VHFVCGVDKHFEPNRQDGKTEKYLPRTASPHVASMTISARPAAVKCAGVVVHSDGCVRDVAGEGSMIQYFLVESRLEHLRRHELVANARSCAAGEGAARPQRGHAQSQ
jgi:hypothetical protein